MTRPARTVGLLNGVIAASLIALLGAVALVVRPPAPPGIAEFAPQASKPMTKAPVNQGFGSGRGPGPCGSSCVTPRSTAGGLPTPSPVPSKVAGRGVPSSLQCYAWADGSLTQTFDPQSPPCIASWPEAGKGNGGATSRGVNRSDIRIGVPGGSGDAELSSFVAFFNSHFEMYGRRLVLVDDGVDGSSADPATQRAHAAKDVSLKVFAALIDSSATHDVSTYQRGLASGHVIGVSEQNSTVTTTMLAKLSPYAWSYYPTFDDEQRNTASFACRALVGRKATHAGDVTLTRTTRSFAVLYPRPRSGSDPDLGPLTDGLRRCGVTAKPIEYVGYPDALNDPAENTNRQVMLQVKQSGATSVILLGSSADALHPLVASSSIGYHPEWLTATWGEFSSGSYTAVPRDELASFMGLAYWNKQVPPGYNPAVQAQAQQHGNQPVYDSYLSEYKALLLVASGVQAAGPRLTPSTFASGLESLRFPNPGAAQAPAYQATVGFGPRGRAMVRDYGLWFWSDRSHSGEYDTASGATRGGYCFVGSGTRWTLDTWPTRDPGLFTATSSC